MTMDVQRTILRRRDFPGCGSSPGPPGPPGPRPPGPAGLGRLRGAFRFPADGRAADWRPVDGDGPTGRTLTRVRPPAGRSLLNCGPCAPLGHDPSPGQGAPYGRDSSRSSSARLWLRSIAFLDLFLDVERLDRRTRDRCLAPGRRSSGDTRHRPRIRSVSRPAALLSLLFIAYRNEIGANCVQRYLRTDVVYGGSGPCRGGRPAVPRPRWGTPAGTTAPAPAAVTDEHPWGGSSRRRGSSRPQPLSGWPGPGQARPVTVHGGPFSGPLQWVRAPRTPRVGQGW